jgi:hypothetical protein
MLLRSGLNNDRRHGHERAHEPNRVENWRFSRENCLEYTSTL